MRPYHSASLGLARLTIKIFLLGLLTTACGNADASPTIAGCPLLPADSVWNTPIDQLPVDPNSTLYIATIGQNTGLHPDFGSATWEGSPIGIPYNLVNGDQEKVPIAFDYWDESDPGPYPIPPDPAIEGGSESDGDRHVLVVDRDNCTLYETWSSYPQSDGSWEAGSGAIFDLGSNVLRPDGWTSSDAAGLPVLPGLVRYEEVATGEVSHAIRFTAPQTRRAYIWPARHYASSLTDLQYPPMGQRFRLRSDFDVSGFSAEVQVILRAMQRYGIILADNGSAWFISGAPDPRWDDDTLVNQLRQVKGSDFEAVDESSLMVDPNSGRARTSTSNLNTDPPAEPTRLIFIHHSTGQNWLADDNGGLGIALRENNYFTSDTNYGWGPGGIGSYTDIGHWWLWFRGPDSTSYMDALYAEDGQNCSYSGMADLAQAGENQVIMFKSCFPNSALRGRPDDPVPAIESNPLRGEDSASTAHTIANAKGIYRDLLEYFRSRQDKLFVVVTAPPLSDPTYAANAREFNNWLVHDWLRDYPFKNVAVFDFYNVLTTNGGSASVNDLGSATGNHHRFWDGELQHKTDGDNDADPNVLEYPSGDDHPSRAGNLKATSEFIPLLNIYYHCWKGTGGCPSGVAQPDRRLAVAAGNFDRDEPEEFAIAVIQPDSSLVVTFYDDDGSTLGQDTLGNAREVALAAGNFYGDSTEEVILAFINSDGNLATAIFDGYGSELGRGSGGQCSNVAVAAGQFDNSDHQLEYVVTLLQADSTLGAITFKADGSRIGKGAGGVCSDLSVAAGNFDGDSNDDEYVISLLQSDGTLAAISFQGNGTRIGKGTGGLCSSLNVDAGNFRSDNDPRDEYVVSLIQSDGTLAAISFYGNGTRIGKGVGGICTNVNIASGVFKETDPMNGYVVSLNQADNTPAAIFFKADGTRIGKGAGTEAVVSTDIACGNIEGGSYDDAVMAYVNQLGQMKWVVFTEYGLQYLSGP